MSPANGKPQVRLGRMVEDGVAPSILGLIERGVAREPGLASEMRGRVVFRFAEEFSPLRITFRPRSVVVEDGDLRKPDLVVAGRLPDIVHLATVPTLGGRLGGLPDPRQARGRRALRRLASGRVRIDGDSALARRLLRLLAV
ncbi:MAG TPA: hypothetical protein VEL05_10710 [Candidatus Acidoferrum sp.]|nr:hypothetical protein [Candidatus Acidoferrum sp.]